MAQKRRSVIFLLFFCILFFCDRHILKGSEWDETIRLIVGQTQAFPASSPSKINIVDPAVVDVVNVTASEFSINAKASGVTDVILTDNFGEQVLHVKVIAEDMNEVKRRVDGLLAKLGFAQVYTEADDDESKVYLLGMVKSKEDKERISLAMNTLKDKIVDLTGIQEEEAVVEIDVQVLELDKDATNTLGITWPGNITLTEQGSPAVVTSDQAQVGTSETISGGTALGTKWSTLFKVLNLSRNQFSFKLDALIQEGKARILSRPRLACQSGKEAELLVGGEKPILTTEIAATSGAQGTEVDYKEYGIKLNIKPVVTEKDRIKLGLKVEVSDVGTAEILGSTSSPTAKAFPLTKRSASTELFVDNGQTLSIGGLIKQKSEEDYRRVPWLSDLPVLGLFFRQKVTKMGGGTGERGNTELFIIITPTIIGETRASQAKKKREPPVSYSSGYSAEPIVKYAQIIQKRILENFVYPDDAKNAGFQGTVKLSLHLSSTGDLLGSSIKESSGYKLLDDYAISAATKVTSYPPFPPSIPGSDLWVDVPITYRLN